MRKVVDLTKSKLPFYEPDHEDLERLQDQLSSLDDEIRKLNEAIDAMEQDAYALVVKESLELIQKLRQAEESINILDDKALLEITFIRGRIFERKLLTENLGSRNHPVVVDNEALPASFRAFHGGAIV